MLLRYLIKYGKNHKVCEVMMPHKKELSYEAFLLDMKWFCLVRRIL